MAILVRGGYHITALLELLWAAKNPIFKVYPNPSEEDFYNKCTRKIQRKMSTSTSLNAFVVSADLGS